MSRDVSLVLLLWCCWIPVPVKAVTLEAFVTGAQNDPLLDHHRRVESSLATLEPGGPLEKVEVRSETDRFELSRQRYALRFYPKGWGEASAYKDLLSNERKVLSVERDTLFLRALHERYLLALDVLETERLTSLYGELVVLEQDRTTLFEQLLRLDDNARVTDLIEAESDLNKARLDHHRQTLRKEELLVQLREYLPAGETLDLDESLLLEVEDLSANLHDLSADVSRVPPRLALATLRSAEAQASYRYELASDRDFLSFFQLQYDSQDHEDLGAAVSLSLSVRLPLVGGNGEKASRRWIEYLDKEFDETVTRRNYSKEVQRERIGLQRSIDQYLLLQESFRSGRATNAYSTYQAAEGTDPAVLLTLKRATLVQKVRLIEQRFEILARYLSLLEKLGHLARLPLRNLLARGARP